MTRVERAAYLCYCLALLPAWAFLGLICLVDHVWRMRRMKNIIVSVGLALVLFVGLEYGKAVVSEIRPAPAPVNPSPDVSWADMLERATAAPIVPTSAIIEPEVAIRDTAFHAPTRAILPACPCYTDPASCACPCQAEVAPIATPKAVPVPKAVARPAAASVAPQPVYAPSAQPHYYAQPQASPCAGGQCGVSRQAGPRLFGGFFRRR